MLTPLVLSGGADRDRHQQTTDNLPVITGSCSHLLRLSWQCLCTNCVPQFGAQMKRNIVINSRRRINPKYFTVVAIRTDCHHQPAVLGAGERGIFLRGPV